MFDFLLKVPLLVDVTFVRNYDHSDMLPEMKLALISTEWVKRFNYQKPNFETTDLH